MIRCFIWTFCFFESGEVFACHSSLCSYVLDHTHKSTSTLILFDIFHELILTTDKIKEKEFYQSETTHEAGVKSSSKQKFEKSASKTR